VPAAPFRALQPGEAAQVLAPLSDTIVVDRAKLASLGFSDVCLSGTAWLLLFWKAAAAGWRSYSVGQAIDFRSLPSERSSPQLREQPDMPVQETEFFLHLALHRDLRRLGPAEPALARGAVAFSRLAAPPATRERPRVLLISPFLPYPL